MFIGTGRKKITTDNIKFTDKNIVDIVRKTMSVHEANAKDIDYLWNYRLGKQPVLDREKPVRPEICNKIVENHADEIVDFKQSYQSSEPIVYVGRTESVGKGIALLNEMMHSEKKAKKDSDLFEWMLVGGTSYKMVLPDKTYGIDPYDDSPFKITVPDPRQTYVVYSNDVDEERLLGVYFYTTDENKKRISVYSKNHYWLIEDDKIIDSKDHYLRYVPIVEYPLGMTRQGAFEKVITLLDAINNLISNRMDGVEQYVQAFLKFINCDISKEQFDDFIARGAIKVNSTDGSNADVDLVSNQLDQTQTQVTKDDLYDSVLTICTMPNRGSSALGDTTGKAVELNNGFTSAENTARKLEVDFKASEDEIIKVILRICGTVKGVPKEVANLKPKDIDYKFTRRNYENILSKVQAFDMLSRNPNIAPIYAFTISGIVPDPENAYNESEKYRKEHPERDVDNKSPIVGQISEIKPNMTGKSLNAGQGSPKSQED